MGGSSSREEIVTTAGEQNIQITNDTTINQNNYIILAIRDGQVNQKHAVAIQKALEASTACSQAIEPVKNDRQQVLIIRKEHIRRYIEETIACGVSIDDLVRFYKQFNERNKWNLDPDLLNQIYAEYFSEPHKKISEFQHQIAALQQRVVTLEQIIRQLQTQMAQQVQQPPQVQAQPVQQPPQVQAQPVQQPPQVQAQPVQQPPQVQAQPVQQPPQVQTQPVQQPPQVQANVALPNPMHDQQILFNANDPNELEEQLVDWAIRESLGQFQHD